MRLTFPARASTSPLPGSLTGLARVRPISDETLADLKLAITEACSNVVRHAYPAGEGSVTIRYELEPTGSRSRSRRGHRLRTQVAESCRRSAT